MADQKKDAGVQKQVVRKPVGDVYRYFGRPVVEYTTDKQLRLVGRRVRLADSTAIVTGIIALCSKHEPQLYPHLRAMIESELATYAPKAS